MMLSINYANFLTRNENNNTGKTLKFGTIQFSIFFNYSAKDFLLDIIIIQISAQNSHGIISIFNIPFVSKPVLNVISCTTSHTRSCKEMLKVLSCELDMLSLVWQIIFLQTDYFCTICLGELHRMLSHTVRIQQVVMCLKCNSLVTVNKRNTTIEQVLPLLRCGRQCTKFLYKCHHCICLVSFALISPYFFSNNQFFPSLLWCTKMQEWLYLNKSAFLPKSSCLELLST